jgi:hypothetical protein
MSRNFIFALALMAAPVLGGCGSNTTESPDTGVALFGLTAGDSCFTITAIAPAFSDGCGLGVDGIVRTSLPLNYDNTTAIVTLGTNGSLGGGAIANNVGTLVRVAPQTIDGTTCTFHETVNSQLQMTANNQFTVSVMEVQSTFGNTCAATDVPAGGTCTSTWTWTMQKSTDATLVPPLCGS